MRNHVWMTLAVIAALLAGPMTVWAGGTPPIGPASVPGKEYSNDLDETAAGLIDMHQNIWWDGTGGAADTFDYTPALPPELQTTTWVDALAHHADYLYDEVSHADATTMVLSTTGLPDILYTAPVHHAPIHGLVPETGVWAAAPIINAASPPDDVDGLEVWGPGGPGGDDADKFSLTGDPGARARARGTGGGGGTRAARPGGRGPGRPGRLCRRHVLAYRRPGRRRRRPNLGVGLLHRSGRALHHRRQPGWRDRPDRSIRTD